MLFKLINYLAIFLFILTAADSIAQNKNIEFGKKVHIQSQFGLGGYSDSDGFVDYSIYYFDQAALLSITKNINLGIHYNMIKVSNQLNFEKNSFYRVGPIIQWDVPPYSSKFKYILEGMLDYGNFVFETDDSLKKRPTIYLGVKIGFEYIIYRNLFARAGYKAIRMLEKGDYGVENYPYLGLSFTFEK